MFDQYLNVVKTCIKNKRLHGEICDELESHLQAEKDYYMKIGYDETAAELKAVEAMGEPVEMGEKMAGLHELSTHQRAGEITFGVVAVLYTLFAGVVHFVCFNEGYEDSQNMNLMYVLQLVFYLIDFIGLKIAMDHYRQSPVWLSLTGLAVLPLNIATSPLYFFLNTLFGFLVEKVGIDSFQGVGIILSYIFTAILFIALLAIVIYPAVRVLKYIRTPYSKTRMKDRKRAEICVLLPLCILILRFMVFIWLIYQGELCLMNI